MKNKRILVLATAFILMSLAVTLNMIGNNQDIRKKAGGGLAVSLGIYPSSDTLVPGQSKVFELKAVFTNGSASQKLDYIKTEVNFDKNFIKIPESRYIDTSGSGLNKVFRVDGPTAANDSGKIIIELGATTPGTGPATDKPFTVAKIYFEGKTNTSSTKQVTIGSTQFVNNQSSSVSVMELQSLSYTVLPQSGPTPTPTPLTPASTISDNFDGGSIDSNKWNIYSNNPQIATSSAIKHENGVLKFTIPSGLTGYTGLSADYKNVITGDYEASVEAKIEQGGTAYGADTFLLMHDELWANAAGISIRKEASGTFSAVAFRKENNNQSDIGTISVTTNNAVTLKLKRVGNTVSYYYKIGTGNFVLLTTAVNTYSGNGWLSLTVNSWEPNYPAITSSFDNFSANVNFAGNPSATPTPSPTPGQTATCMTLPQSDNFSGATTSANLWTIRRSINGDVTQPNGTMRGFLPGGGTGWAGLVTNGKVCGDFDVRVDFSQFTTSGQPESDARLIITDQIVNETNTQIFIQRYSQGNVQGFWSDLKRTDGSYFGGSQANTTATSGILRIRRQGSVYTTYYDDGAGWKKLGYYPSGFSGNAYIIIDVGSWGQNPSVSTNFDNFNLTAAIPDPSITPVPTSSPIPTASPSPTPPSGREKYIIDPGEKQSLLINIGAAISPQIKFTAKLSSLRAYPELYLRLRVHDELAFLDNPGNTSGDSCNNVPKGDSEFVVPMKATGDIYSPVQQISQPAPKDAVVAIVSGDGWVTLDGVIPGRNYTFYLKGPKTRKSRMIDHMLLQPNQSSVQVFDWTGKPLDPGDLPDPNNGGKQDCTINSTDWSLEKARIGATDGDNLAVCDVNYDGICNAGDSVAILDTLSKRPDDDI